MACWSAENATKAYLKTLKMGKRCKEPDVAEFVSALAAGNSAKYMVEACSGTAGATTLALVVAAHQTGGRVVCILRGIEELESSQLALGPNVKFVDFVIGDARKLLLNCYKGADFVLIDCNLDDHEGVLRAVQASAKDSGAVAVGYNAFSKGSWWKNGFKTHLLPIGEGLLVSTIPASNKNVVGRLMAAKRSSNWVVRVDKCTGEEHVFRVLRSSPPSKEIEA
ncbi:Protein of unknown function DUF1442 [Macleaya cordata]|uniref:S-adenosyl-L-methionine-dependent methyltransferase n=1 Tax=Macleaya cordata TaxID=56857 RepID=A0A200QB15_MACCD|nr:Protein of unknown function DUF1442 [Macleaya cordata]